MSRGSPARRPVARWAAVAVAAAAGLAGCRTVDSATDDAQVRAGVRAIDGIAQDGFTLGDPQAPWTLSVISSPTSFELDHLIGELPRLTRFVREGRLNVQMRTPTKGPYGVDGEERVVAGVLLAAGLQDRYWDALVRFVPRYRGNVSVEGLAALLRRAGVPDVDLAMTKRSNAQVRGALNRADVVAAAAAGEGQVVYVLTSRAGAIRPLTVPDKERTLADAVTIELR